MQVNHIGNGSTADAAPDRYRRRPVGGVDCHFAMKGNLNGSHPEQQDRASVMALENIHPDAFGEIMTQAFDAMHVHQQMLTASDKEFEGDCCVNMTFLDPRTGKMAIGKKGDADTYIILQNKYNKDDTIIQRISFSAKGFTGRYDGQDGIIVNMIGQDTPPYWASHHSWKKEKEYLEPKDRREECGTFKIQDVAADILAARAEKKIFGDKKPKWWSPKRLLAHFRQPSLKNYTISLLVASDGITAGRLFPEQLNKRMQEIATIIGHFDGNKASGVLHAVSNTEISPSKDNLSAIVLSNIEIGKGESIAMCVCDGNHNGNMERLHDGSVSAQRAMDTFEFHMNYQRSEASMHNDGHSKKLATTPVQELHRR